MNKQRAKMVYQLVLHRDPNLLNTIKRVRGENTFKQMSGTSIYRWAKKLWKKYGKEDNWGYGTNS